MDRLTIAPDKRHLLKGGQPFFYLSCTIWKGCTRMKNEDWNTYLTNRAAKGFTVIQTVVLFERTEDRYGNIPLNSAVGLNSAYMEHVYYMIEKAAELGLYVGLFPVWGRDNVQGVPIITPTNAFAYGQDLGATMFERHFDNIIWIMGGDCKAETDYDKAVWRNLVSGIQSTYGDDALFSYHPGSKGWSGAFFGYAPDLWCMHGIQSGQGARDINSAALAQTNLQGSRLIQPIFNLESCYEEQPVNFNVANGRFNDHDVRNDLYRSLLGGCAGVAYGHNSIWQCVQPGLSSNGTPLGNWYEKLDTPAANQVKHLKTLNDRLGSYFDYKATLTPETLTPDKRTVGALSSDEKAAHIYTPVNRPFIVNLNPLSPLRLAVEWFDPSTGGRVFHQTIDNNGLNRTFTPPSMWADAVLTLYDNDVTPPPDPTLSDRLDAVIAELISIKAELDGQ